MDERFILVGGSRLTGKTYLSGAKNSVLPIMAATLLVKGKSVIKGVPRLYDVTVMKEALQYLGACVEFKGSRIEVDASNISEVDVPPELTRKLRASNLIMGAVLGRCGKASVAFPGGCSIGSRPMDLHLRGLSKLGAEINRKSGYICASADGLSGADIHLDFPSVGATENIMLAAVMAEGRTVIKNAAREPEIIDLQNFLNSSGAKIKGAGLDTIVIEGVKELNGVEHEVIPDRIEAATLMIAGAITGGDITIMNAIPEHVEPVVAKLRETGLDVDCENEKIRVRAGEKLKAVNIKTLPYPGFPTDVQAQMMALLSISRGTSMITEIIFENRFKHAGELKRMGADITIEGKTAVIKGVSKLSGTYVEATDLRAGVALVLAGLAADDMTVVENVHHIDRGYECIEKKLSDLGAKIVRI